MDSRPFSFLANKKNFLFLFPDTIRCKVWTLHPEKRAESDILLTLKGCSSFSFEKMLYVYVKFFAYYFHYSSLLQFSQQLMEHPVLIVQINKK